jgi:hypothetical protein
MGVFKKAKETVEKILREELPPPDPKPRPRDDKKK